MFTAALIDSGIEDRLEICRAHSFYYYYPSLRSRSAFFMSFCRCSSFCCGVGACLPLPHPANGMNAITTIKTIATGDQEEFIAPFLVLAVVH
jgi:hypothetical protein